MKTFADLLRARRPRVQVARRFNAAWDRLSAHVLAIEPLCRTCLAQGRVTPAVDVDHVVPVRLGGTDVMSNLQPLCKVCHLRKTRAETKLR